MEDQIINAVQIALSGTSDQKLQLQAYEFLNDVKSSKSGYNTALELLSKSTSSNINNELKFFLYQVIEENVQSLSREESHQLVQSLFKILSELISNDIKDQSYLRNKFGQIFGKVFTQVYMNIYPDFLKNLHEIIQNNNQLTLDYYTRILINIHLEIGDKYIARLPEVAERNMLLKDAIRDKDMNELVSSWFGILAQDKNSEEILDNTLNIVGQYVDWMDISLFVSPQYINTIIGYLNREQERNTTCDTLIHILSKKMPPQNKLELISLLNLTNIISSIDMSDDLDFVEHLAKLANQIGEELLYALGNQTDINNQVKEHLFKLWPIILTFLSHEYDDISQCVFPFIQSFLTACKKDSQLFSVDLLSTLLNKIVIKMEYDDEADDDEDSERQFKDFRTKLKHFQDLIAVLAPDLYIEAIPVLINDSLFTGGDKSWNKLELGLYELSNFSESLKMNLINVPKNKINESKPYLVFQDFLIKLINSSFIVEVNHSQIQASFFELIVKHYSFLNSHANRQDLILRILEIFTSPLGLFNDNERVRLRSWYLFFRFFKLTKPKMDNEQLIEQIVIKLQPLLVIKAELPTRDEDDDVVENGNFSNQQYLFETMGLLVSLIPNDLSVLKVKLIDALFQPIFNDLEKCISMDKEPIVVLQAHHSLMALGTIARGYDYESNLKFTPEVVEKVDNAAQVVSITLENFSKFESIRDASRFAFARFIPILNSSIISGHLTKLITIIWSSSNLKINEISDFLSFLGQIAHSYRTDENIYQLLNNFLTPLFSKVFQSLDLPVSEDESQRPDILRDKTLLKKAILNFLSAIIINNLSSLLITESNKNEFPTVVSKLFEYAYDLSETAVSKLAILQLVNLVNVFGDGGKITDERDKYGQSLPAVQGIDEFLMEKVVNLTFELPFRKQEFVLGDAQYRLIAQDLATLLKTYQLKKGQSFIEYLSSYLTSMGLNSESLNDFCSNLINLDIKDFKKYFVTLISMLDALIFQINIELGTRVHHAINMPKNKSGDEVPYPPKDEEELQLEKLVFGDIAGLENNLRKVGSLFDFDDEDEEEVVDNSENSGDESDDINDVQDEDLFFIDEGNNEDNSEVDDMEVDEIEDEESEEENGLYEEGDAWVDSDDETFNISLTSSDRLKKLRKTPEDNNISGKSYIIRLRSQFEKIYPRPLWADKFGQDNEENSSDDDIVIDGAEEDEEQIGINAQTNTKKLNKLLSTTHQFLTTKQLKLISPSNISITRLKDANYQKYSKAAIQALSFHPTHSILLTAGFDKTIRLYQIDGKTNNFITSYYLKNCPIMNCQFYPNPNEKIIYAAGRRKYMNKINLQTGEIEKISRMYGHEENQKSFESFKISNKGTYIGMIGNSGWFNLINGITGQWIKGFKIEGTVVDFDFDHDEKFVVVVNSAGEVWEFSLTEKLTSKSENKVLKKWSDDGGVGITKIKLGGRNSRWVAIGSNNGYINLYDRTLFTDISNPKPFKTIENLVTSISTLIFNADGQILAIASRAKRDALKLVHVQTGSVYSNWPTSGTPLGKVTSVTFSPNNEILAIGNEAGKVTLWRLNHY
ncbi:LOS1 [Candida pseudojiufengensis]|uniref:LOS1 n=1 Tax=Candida pseudojiufengensis TaxID=497109 RepID=UPI0022245DAC|nr:LOS1 [Candida pseudojiufengensis]KAI5960803.1 LOS1 [Candida pseudojiufengensis]